MFKGRSRVFAVLIAAALCLVFAACGSSDDNAGTAESSSTNATGDGGAEGKKVVALIAGTNVPYLATYSKQMQEDAAEAGMSLDVQSADFDANRQSQQFDDAIASQPDAIIINAVDAKAIVPSLLKAQQAGIPVVASNNGVDASAKELVEGYTGPDDVAEGAMAAEIMADVLDGKGHVAIVEGALGTTPQINRTKGFTEKLAEVAPEIEIIGKQTGAWDKAKARSVTADFITRFGDKVNGVFGEDDTMASGAAQAVRDAGKADQIKVVGLGGSTLGFDGVEDGSIAGTLIQSPKGDAGLAIEAVAKVLGGESLPENTYLEPIKVMPSNVDEYEPEW